MDTTGNSPGLKPGECESILDITRTAIANGHVDLVQRQFNKLVDRVIDLSTRIIEATSSAMEDREVTFVRHVDPLICPSGMLARASSTTHPREGSSSRGSSVRSSVGHLGKPRGSLVSNGAFGRREWSLPLSDNGSGNGNKNSVLKRRLSTVSKDGSVGSSQRRMSIGADLRRRSSVSHLARRETYSTDEFGISHNTCPGRLQSSATGIGVCSEERHDGPPPVTEEELTDEEVKATLAVLEEGHPSLQTYYELLHVHSCKDALHCVTEAHTKGALIISSQAKPENVRDVQEEPQEHSLSNFSVCFVSALFSHYSDRCGKSQGASLDNHRETTVKLESAEENSLGGSKGGSTEEAGNIFICTNAFFQKQPSPGKQTAQPLTHLVREVTTTPKESLNSSESSVDGKGNPSEKNGGPTNFVPVEWHPARSAELALRNDSIVMPRTNERRDVIKVSNECGSEWCTNGDSTPGGNAFVVNCTASTYALFTGLPLLSSSGISGSGADANCCIAATETAVPMAAVESSLEGGDSSASTTHTGKSGVLGCETARELSGSRLTIELRITKSPSLQSVQALQVVQMATWRRPITLLYGNVLHRSVAARTAAVSDLSTPLPVVLCGSKRGVKLSNPIGKQGSQHYGTEPKLEAGKDVQIKHTEMYDGYTDDFGVFKEGPPMTLRLEYVRSPDHGFSQQLLQKDIWSPFQVNANMMIYTPLYYDWQGFSSRDYWGHRSGTNPGSKVVMGHYRRVEERSWGYRIMVNHKPQKRVPKWLACIVHLPRKKKFVGFFLYANGAYVAELLTYKQLPRICYNKRSSSGLPTIGQTVSLSEVTYGKELHSVEMYPGHGGVICRASGAAAVVLRGAEPNLVPLLLPSKEVRLFDNECHAVFGRRAGVMYRYQRNFGKRNVEEYMPHRPKVHSKTKRVSSHPAGGGNGGSSNLLVPLDWRIHPRNCVKTKYWLSGYILRGRQYNKGQTVADIKSKTYSWANRDPVYR